MILNEIIYKTKLLNLMKDELNKRGYTYKTIGWIDAQLNVLKHLTLIESNYILNDLLKKTNFRLLKRIEKGIENLADIVNNPFEWYLSDINDNLDEWRNSKAFIFSTEKQTLVFTQNIGQKQFKYFNNKWQ